MITKHDIFEIHYDGIETENTDATNKEALEEICARLHRVIKKMRLNGSIGRTVYNRATRGVHEIANAVSELDRIQKEQEEYNDNPFITTGGEENYLMMDALTYYEKEWCELIAETGSENSAIREMMNYMDAQGISKDMGIEEKHKYAKEHFYKPLLEKVRLITSQQSHHNTLGCMIPEKTNLEETNMFLNPSKYFKQGM